MCPRCRGEFLPDKPRAAFISDMWRAPAKGMTQKPDPRAERIKRRKEAKARLAVVREGIRQERDTGEPVTIAVTTPLADVVSEECQDCLKLKARFLGYDPKTNRAYAQIIP